MLVGSLNDARLPLEAEIERVAAGFDFIDLTLEPPCTWPVEGALVRRLLEDSRLVAVGHTPPFLPHASPLAEVARAARSVFCRMLDVFAGAGIELVNIHPDTTGPGSLQEVTVRNADALAALTTEADARGLTLMVENFGRTFSTPRELEPLFEAAPNLRLHLDVGHANMRRVGDQPNRTSELLEAFGERLAHVHVHDNRGGDDLHLPLGLGTVEWAAIVVALKSVGYDGTVTIEVFAPDADLQRSRDAWLRWWNSAPAV
jgi:sugar phosphate isomerase/epimerase